MASGFKGNVICFAAILTTAWRVFAADEAKLSNVHWHQDFPYNSYLLQTEAMPNGSAGTTGMNKAGRHPTGCVQTAYSQLVAYHEWPAIIDDDYEGFGSIGADGHTYTYSPHFHVTGHDPIDWNLIKNGDTSNEAYNFQIGRLFSLVTCFAFPVFNQGDTASTVSCPHYNPWYESDVAHFGNPADPGTARDELFAAARASIDAGLPVAAGFQSSGGTHAVVLEGYRTEADGTLSFWANMGWGAGRDEWSNYALSPSVGKNNSITGVYPMHAPRKMVQLAPVPAVCGPCPTIRWFAPKYWKPQIESYEVAVARANEFATTWSDSFATIATKWPTKIRCGGHDKDDHTDIQNIFRVVDSELWCFKPFDPRYYEWPETFVATDRTVLSFDSNVCNTEGLKGEVQIKVANQPWKRLFDLNEDGRYDKVPTGEWADHRVAVTGVSGQPFKIRLAFARCQRIGTTDDYLWKLRNFTLENVRTFGLAETRRVDKAVETLALDELDSDGIYEVSVAPVIDGVVGDCFRSVATRVQTSGAQVPELSVTKKGAEPTDGVFFACGYRTSTELLVTTTVPLKTLGALSGNLACYGAEDISSIRLDDQTWKVKLTPNANFIASYNASRADGQRMMLTLVGIDANGTAVYKDLSLEFCSKVDEAQSSSGGAGCFSYGDFYLPSLSEDEWTLTISAESDEDTDWDTATFMKKDGTTCRGGELPSDAKVRIRVTDPMVPTSVWDYKGIRFPTGHKVTLDTLTVEAIGTQAPLRFLGIPNYVTCARLNVASAMTQHNGVVKAETLWVGYESTLVTAGGFLDCFKRLEGTGTVKLEQNAPPAGVGTVDHSRFLGYVTGQATLEPTVAPSPDRIGESAGDDDGAGGSTGETIGTSAQDPVLSLNRTYGYAMTEDYWDARKEAIRLRKKLFVLSGSTSCNWCHQTMIYLQSLAAKIDPDYVCYYAKRQNGNVPMLGGLPQYGTFDPRTIDAFTGTKDADGNFKPEMAWYSGSNNAFDSDRGFGEVKIDRCLKAAEDKSVGRFVRFTLEGPQSVFSRTPTKFRLYAHFDDGVKMEVDHGVEWKIVAGDATITTDGYVTVKSGRVQIAARNAFYDFGVRGEGNTLTAELSVVDSADVVGLELVTTSFNLEDDTTVRLRAMAELRNGEKTTAEPNWEVSLKEFVPLPENVPLYEQKDGAISLDETENGRIHYLRDSGIGNGPHYYGINLQDHVLHVKATLGTASIEQDVPVYGPTRVWPTKWEIVSSTNVAPGSVIRVQVTELSYTYGGAVYTTTNTAFAQFQTGYVKDYTGYRIEGVTAVDIPVTEKSSRVEELPVSVAARKKGGKYNDFDRDVRHQEIRERFVTFHPAESYLVSAEGIRLNQGWLKIFFPARTDFQTLVDEDSDDDGFTNAEEFLLGTDPTDPQDRWRFTSSHFDWPNEVYYRVMFMDHQFSGRLYTIEGATTPEGPWSVLGTANGQLVGLISEENVTAADASRLFRVKVQLTPSVLEPYESAEFIIPGYGVWKDVTLAPQAGARYAAFVVDANDLAYQIPVSFDPSQDLSKPVFSLPTEQVMSGTLGRLVPTIVLKEDNWRFIRVERGIWTDFYAIKASALTPVSVAISDNLFKISIENVDSECWYALEKTTDLTKPFVVDPTTWTPGASLLAGTSELVIALRDCDPQAFYRVVVSTTAP